VPLVLLTALFEAAGAAAVFGLIRVLTDPAQATALPVAGALLRRLPPLEPRATVVLFALSVALFYALKNGLGALSAWAQARCVRDSTAATSTALLRGYLAAPWSFHLRRNSAELIHDAHQAVERVYTLVMSPALGILTESLVALGIVAVLLVAAPGVTLFAVSVLLSLSLLFLRITRGAAVRLGARLDVHAAASLRHLQQALGAVKELKVLGRERRFADSYAEDQRALARVHRRYATIAALPRLVVETIFVCGALLVVVVLTARGGTGTETVPLLGLYAYAGFRVIPSANRILWLFGEVRFGTPAVERVHRDLAILPAVAPAPTGPCPFVDRLALERVSYVYPADARPLLCDVELVVRRGEAVGIVGPTGAGKSTLVDLVVGLLEPTEGRISVDGVDVRTCLPAWQHQIGYVPQAIYLLDDTLRRNIALGVPDAEIDETRLRAAIGRAQLEAFVAALPQGLDTRVGERGVRLSGGERQRIGIARALYHEPAVLVFDEATSALDGRTEAALTEALGALRGGTTMLIVAHRLTSVRRCDRLVLLRDGRVADTGSFDELVTRSAEFRALAATAGGR
jgi:ATP-binding cassette subfamily C protein